MNIRTSTLGMFERALTHMQAAQTRLAHTQEQLATGSRMMSAKDDPAAAGVAVALDRCVAEFERFEKNADTLVNRLSLQESVLSTVNDVLGRLREIALQGNNASLDATARNALLPEISTLKDALLAAANAQDAAGRHLFGGTRDQGVPFVDQGGAVLYSGDQMRRSVDVAPDLAVADTDPGSEVFLRIRTGNGEVAARATATNAGTAVLKTNGFVDQSQWDGGSYRVAFNAGNYQVLDAVNAVVAAGAFVPGQAIAFRGFQITLDGVPATGDSFTVAPAATQDVFALVDRVIAALQTADTPASGTALRQNRFFSAIEDIAQASAHLIDMRAATGARMAMLETVNAEREGALINTRATLSNLRDLDYADAISRLSRESATLEAAQQSFSRVQSLSLFNFLR